MKVLAVSDDKSWPNKQAKVEIYVSGYCVFCVRAKLLLDELDISYSETRVDGDVQARQAMTERARGRHSVPQIFINNEAIGGFYDLLQLEQSGELLTILFPAAD
jgi:glutaredoxin 3